MKKPYTVHLPGKSSSTPRVLGCLDFFFGGSKRGIVQLSSLRARANPITASHRDALPHEVEHGGRSRSSTLRNLTFTYCFPMAP